jgi:hypothetical protein
MNLEYVMKCKYHGQECSGPFVKLQGFSHLNLCTYHGELVVKLETMTLAQLERLHQKAVWERQKPKYATEARKLALCSDIVGFHKHAEDVYKGTYDYRNH